MHRKVRRGNTLILKGPASLTLLDGSVSVLSGQITIGDRVIVRRGKALPFEVEEEDASLELVLGIGATYEEISGSTIPHLWAEIVNNILTMNKHVTVMMLGGDNTGKTTFSTYLLNKALKVHYKPAIIDLDMGQSEIGPPTSIGLGIIIEPIADLFTIEPRTIFFTGQTSPNGISERVITGFEFLKTEIPKENVDFIVINTDGWVEGEKASIYKTRLIKKACPDLIVAIQKNNELNSILAMIEEEGFNVHTISTSPALKRRDKAERRESRSQGYNKYLGSLSTRILPMDWVRLEYTFLYSGNSLNQDQLVNLQKSLGSKIIFCEDYPKKIFIVISEKERVDETKIQSLQEYFNKTIHIVNEEEEKGLLIGLLNKNREFLGLGIIQEIDYINRTLKILTSHREEINIVQFSQIKIDQTGKELGITTLFSF